MLYINQSLNSIVFDEEDYSLKKNYLPSITLALRELDPLKEIHFLINLEKTPVLFVLAINKFIKESQVNISLYQYVCK